MKIINASCFGSSKLVQLVFVCVTLNKWACEIEMQNVTVTQQHQSGESLALRFRQSLSKLKAQSLLFSKISNNLGK